MLHVHACMEVGGQSLVLGVCSFLVGVCGMQGAGVFIHSRPDQPLMYICILVNDYWTHSESCDSQCLWQYYKYSRKRRLSQTPAWLYTVHIQGFPTLSKLCSHFSKILLTFRGCKGNNGKNCLLIPGTSSQSEGYNSKWLIWLVCREPRTLTCMYL